MEPNLTALESCRVELIAARQLVDQAATKLISAYGSVRPECMPPRHLIENRLKELARRIAFGIEEVDEKIEALAAVATPANERTAQQRLLLPEGDD